MGLFTIAPAERQVAIAGEAYTSRMDDLKRGLEQRAEHSRADVMHDLAEMVRIQGQEIARLRSLLTAAPSREIAAIAMAATDTGKNQESARQFVTALCADGSLWATELARFGKEDWRRISPLPTATEEAETLRQEQEATARKSREAAERRLAQGAQY